LRYLVRTEGGRVNSPVVAEEERALERKPEAWRLYLSKGKASRLESGEPQERKRDETSPHGSG
jgi:hypothetical protein